MWAVDLMDDTLLLALLPALVALVGSSLVLGAWRRPRGTELKMRHTAGQDSTVVVIIPRLMCAA
jgi:Ca2+/H+ antiporter